MATRSFSLSLSTSRRIACFTSGNRSAGIIEPETSRRKTRLLAGRFSFATSRPFNPIRNNRWVGSHGHAVASRSIENGLSPSGSLAWNIQKKNEGARRPFSVRNLASFQSNPQQPMGRLPRARRRVEIDRERLIALWLFIIVGEIVDHLLDSHRVFRRQRTRVNEAPDVRVRSGVDIDREGGEGIGRRWQERILLHLIVGRGVEVLPVTRRRFGLHRLAGNRSEERRVGK